MYTLYSCMNVYAVYATGGAGQCVGDVCAYISRFCCTGIAVSQTCCILIPPRAVQCASKLQSPPQKSAFPPEKHNFCPNKVVSFCIFLLEIPFSSSEESAVAVRKSCADWLGSDGTMCLRTEHAYAHAYRVWQARQTAGAGAT